MSTTAPSTSDDKRDFPKWYSPTDLLQVVLCHLNLKAQALPKETLDILYEKAVEAYSQGSTTNPATTSAEQFYYLFFQVKNWVPLPQF